MDGIETTDALLDDPGDLHDDEIIADAIMVEQHGAAEDDSEDRDDEAAVVVADESPVHLARCAECQHEVKYQPSCTGASFMLVEAGDATYGIGEHGRPVCPNGHGEMAIADDALKPVPEAFADAQAMLLKAEAEAVQGELPDIFPAFNWAGAGKDMAEQACRVNALKAIYDDAADKAKKAKKDWDAAEELLTKMGVEYDRRARAKSEPDPVRITESAKLPPCAWTQAYPDDPCPFCSVSSIAEREAIVGLLGAELLPRDANGHADQVVTYRTKVDVQGTADMLAGVVFGVHLATIAEWSPEHRSIVRAWVSVVHAASDVASEPPFPVDLGRPHRAGVVQDGEQAQRCVACSQTIKTFDDRADAYQPLVMVGLDCPGEERDEHRYPDTSKPKRPRKPRAEEPEPKAEAAPKAKAKKKPATEPKHQSFPKPSSKKHGKKGRS